MFKCICSSTELTGGNMKFGYFDDEKKEYVITTPYTPLPWINYLGSEDFFSLISNTGGGYSFYKDAKMRRITRFRYNNVPQDNGGRLFYIEDGENRFSPSFLPLKTPLEKYECRHGLGYTTFNSALGSLETSLTIFVPLSDTCEIMKLKIKNTSKKKKEVRVVGAVEWCLWNALDDQTNFQRNYSTGEVEIEKNAIYHKTEYRERRNHYAFFSSNKDVSSFDSDRLTFLGKFNNYDSPDGIRETHLFNSKASGWSPIAALENIVEIEPGEEETLIYVLGYIENNEDEKWESKSLINKTKAHSMMERYNSEERFDAAFASLSSYWSDLLSSFTVDTKTEKFDRMVNIWNQYQCMVTFNMSRSASYYESGIGRGMGFRDSCQDLLGFMHIIPDRARERIIDIASIQFEDGSTYHQYQPLDKKGNSDIGGGFNDDPLWLVAAVYSYLAETNDYSILSEMVPFDNDVKKAQPLLEHLKRSIMYTINHKGPHGLPLIGRADWNDCLNLNCFSKTPGESFQTCSNFESGKAESVFIAGLFVKYAKAYIEILEHLGKNEEKIEIEKEVEKMVEAVKGPGWDGEWFVRAYDAFSNPIGSKTNEDGKIFIESQGMCVMAGIGLDDGKAEKALKSVEKHLDSKYGIILVQPAYKEYHLNLGEVSSYPPGYKENAGIFCHNNPWVSCAETLLGHGDRAFEIYKKISPSYTEDIGEIHKTEPYVYCQMVAGRDAQNEGEGKNSWLTGCAAWTFVNASQFILGITPRLSGLEINPVLPSTINSFTLKRKMGHTTYHITGERGSEYSLTVDGERINGKIVERKEKEDVFISVIYK